jgi:hypothetical protein
MLTIGKDGSYATLHARLTLAAGPNPLGTFRLTALDASRQAWLTEVNSKRATISTPASFSNLVVDEYAQEQADRWASDATSGAVAFSDAGYAPYQTAYGASPGAMYAAGGVLDESGAPATAFDYSSADDAWFAEKANCSNGNWQTCPFSGTTGHYINLSNTQDVWVGLGLSPSSAANGTYFYDIMIIQDNSATGPASFRRATAPPVRKH